jgi:hypothetical protein
MAQKVYTYVLRDLETDLYKIGKSINPRARFRQLCRPGKVVPIHVFHKDIEGALHVEYNSERLKSHPNPAYSDGHTEWFRYGGKLKPFIDSLDKQDIAFYSPHNLYEYLNVFIPEVAVLNQLRQTDYYQYTLGRKILSMLGYLYYNGIGYDTCHHGVILSGPKTFINDTVMIEILNNHTIEIVANRFNNTLSKYKELYGKKVFVRKVDALDDATPIYIVIAEI